MPEDVCLMYKSLPTTSQFSFGNSLPFIVMLKSDFKDGYPGSLNLVLANFPS